ncbi:unnamed protein product, partial [marine sediment metagenome]
TVVGEGKFLRVGKFFGKKTRTVSKGQRVSAIVGKYKKVAALSEKEAVIVTKTKGLAKVGIPKRRWFMPKGLKKMTAAFKEKIAGKQIRVIEKKAATVIKAGDVYHPPSKLSLFTKSFKAKGGAIFETGKAPKGISIIEKGRVDFLGPAKPGKTFFQKVLAAKPKHPLTALYKKMKVPTYPSKAIPRYPFTAFGKKPLWALRKAPAISFAAGTKSYAWMKRTKAEELSEIRKAGTPYGKQFLKELEKGKPGIPKKITKDAIKKG